MISIKEADKKTSCMSMDGGKSWGICTQSGVLKLWEYNGTRGMSGLYAFKSTHGIPLSLSVQLCLEKGLKPDLLDYVACGLREGEKREQLERDVDEALRDAGHTRDSIKLTGRN
jgi:hypothetical protein